MHKILFICHGNICRSPMAEYILREMAREQSIEIEVASAATSREEIGNPVYPPVRKILQARGIDASSKRAQQMTRADYEYYDRIICMEEYNRQNALRLLGGDPAGKIEMLLERDVADPWYSGDFATTERQIAEGCKKLLLQLQSR